MKTTRTLLILAAAAAAVACGGSDPEAKLVKASEAANAARSEVEVARESVQQSEKEVQDAQQRLTEARAELREAQQKMAEREATVDRNATDAVLFRTIQKQLLDDRALQGVAISASVRSSVVTLTGTVPEQKISDRAIEIAGAAPGVARVENRIKVTPADPEKAAD
jgi:osmotically-inducible protein OsmY